MKRLAIFLCLVPCGFAAEPLRVEVARDLWISSYEKEREGNNGASPKLVR